MKDKLENEHIDGKDFNFLIGKSVIDVIEDKNKDPKEAYLKLSDGTILRIDCNEGCVWCSNGWSDIDLSVLKNNRNIITDVKYKEDENCWEDEFTLFIYYSDGKINEVHGDDGYGNGYYGGGFYLSVISEGE